jgi:hypothetical protein
MSDLPEVDDGDRELRVISVSATVTPHINEEAMAEHVQEQLREATGPHIEIGTVDIYEHKAHSGSPETGGRADGGPDP